MWHATFHTNLRTPKSICDGMFRTKNIFASMLCWWLKMRDFLRVIFKQYETLYCTVFDQKLELCEICLCKSSVDVVSRSLGFSIISYRNHQFSCLTCQWTDIGVMVGMNKYSHGKSGLMTCCPFNNNSMRSCSIFARRPKLQ